MYLQTNKIKRPLENITYNDDDSEFEKYSTKTRHYNPGKVRAEKEMKPAETVQHVFAVNGTVVSFNGFDLENFTNWFAEAKK